MFVFGLLPRAIGLAWALLVWAVLMIYYGGPLSLPQQMMSPYMHIPRMPAADFTALPLVILSLVSAALATAGPLGFRRRPRGDVTAAERSRAWLCKDPAREANAARRAAAHWRTSPV